jgi:hypothetical protein
MNLNAIIMKKRSVLNANPDFGMETAGSLAGKDLSAHRF